MVREVFGRGPFLLPRPIFGGDLKPLLTETRLVTVQGDSRPVGYSFQCPDRSGGAGRAGHESYLC